MKMDSGGGGGGVINELSPEYIEKLRTLEKYIEPLSKLVEDSNANVPPLDVSKMDALRSIIKGEQMVSLSVLIKCEMFLRQRFPDFHDVTFVQKPLKDFTEEEKHFIQDEVVSLIKYYSQFEAKVRDMKSVLKFLNQADCFQHRSSFDHEQTTLQN